MHEIKNYNVSVDDNTTGFWKQRKYGTVACGYCDTDCVYNAIEIGFTVGVLANLLVIIRVARDKRLRDPTFIGIAALAFADLLFLTLNLTISFESVISAFTCQKSVILSRPWYIMNSMFWFSANSHVALLAVIRYMSLANPCGSSVFLRPFRVIMLSAGVWILGMILLGTLAGLITLKIVKPGSSSEFIIIWWITVYLLPLIVTTILHIMKICLVKRSVAISSARGANRKLVQRMSSIVMLVIVLAAVLPLPRLVYNCLRVVGDSAFPSKSFKDHFQGISQLLYLINHFINPFMYGFLSRKFRRSLKEMFYCVNSNKSDSTDTTDSPISSTKQSVAMENVERKASEDYDLHGDVGTLHGIVGYRIMDNYM